jgi:hypothetical protein
VKPFLWIPISLALSTISAIAHPQSGVKQTAKPDLRIHNIGNTRLRADVLFPPDCKIRSVTIAEEVQLTTITYSAICGDHWETVQAFYRARYPFTKWITLQAAGASPGAVGGVYVDSMHKQFLATVIIYKSSMAAAKYGVTGKTPKKRPCEIDVSITLPAGASIRGAGLVVPMPSR